MTREPRPHHVAAECPACHVHHVAAECPACHVEDATYWSVDRLFVCNACGHDWAETPTAT